MSFGLQVVCKLGNQPYIPISISKKEVYGTGTIFRCEGRFVFKGVDDVVLDQQHTIKVPQLNRLIVCCRSRTTSSPLLNNNPVHRWRWSLPVLSVPLVLRYGIVSGSRGFSCRWAGCARPAIVCVTTEREREREREREPERERESEREKQRGIRGEREKNE